MADSVVRRDVIQVTWDVEDSPLGKLTKEANKFQSTVKKAVGGSESEMNKFAKDVQKPVSGFKKLKDSIKAVDKTSLKTITKAITDLNSKISKGLVSGAKKAAKAIAKIGAAGAAGFAALATASVKGYGDYEQLVGGVETLFKDSKNTVMKYANDAYKTAGMSANEYMETVTGFSASLLQSLGGDTKKAADKSNLALTDMSDNANKMGTDMESIKNAYSGFAKQNYTMLDNLKLGYGGTKEEMERLLKDASKISGQKYDISSFADMVDAIHVVQTEMGITGTTAKEAATTIQGSVNSMKGAWQNFLVGMADPDQNFGQLVDNLVESIVTVAKNIIPRIKATLPRLAQGLRQLFSELFTLATQNLDMLGPLAPVVQTVINVFTSIKAKIQSITADNEKMTALKGIFDGIKTAVSNAATFAGALVTDIIDFCSQAPILNLIKAIVSGVSKAFEFLGSNMNLITNILVGIIAFIGSLAAIIKVVSIAMKVWAAIQLVVNSGLLACPITWIVLAIAALIAIIVVLVKNWDKVKAAAVGCWNKIKSAWSNVSNWFKSSVIDPVKNFFSDLWKSLPAPVKGALSSIFDRFKFVFTQVKTLWSGLTDFFKKLFTGDLKGAGEALKNTFVEMWKNTVKAVAKPVNKLIDGANWIMDKLGFDKKFDPWQPYARGTDGHPGGNAIVNDGRGAELVQMPNGMTFIPKGRNVGIPNAPKGMKVLDAQRTAQLMGRSSPTFNYKEGTGWDIFDFFDNAGGLVGKVIEKFVNFRGMTGLALDAGKALIHNAKEAMKGWVKGLFDKCGGKSLESYEPSKGVNQWKSTVEQALKMEGLNSADNIKRTLYQMQTESGGNPRAINNWDSNAKKGTPSKGLMQVIDPTFKSYARKGYASNIYDPLSNVLASVRYAKSRYGSLAKAYRGVGYASGIGASGIRLPVYSPASSVGASSSSYSRETNNYSPSFSLTMNGTTDRTTERTIKKWVYEAIQETFASMERANPRVREV